MPSHFGQEYYGLSLRYGGVERSGLLLCGVVRRRMRCSTVL